MTSGYVSFPVWSKKKGDIKPHSSKYLSFLRLLRFVHKKEAEFYDDFAWFSVSLVVGWSGRNRVLTTTECRRQSVAGTLGGAW